VGNIEPEITEVHHLYDHLGWEFGEGKGIVDASGAFLQRSNAVLRDWDVFLSRNRVHGDLHIS